MIGKYLPVFGLRDILGEIVPRGDGLGLLRERLAAFYGCRYVFLFRSARNAICAVLRALGDTGLVVVPAYNCIAVPEAVTWAGWQPVFADVACGTVNMTDETLTQVLSDDVSAVVLTHQFGIPSDVDSILRVCRERGLFVIEDAAAALGARYRGRPAGSFGDATVVSFHLTKVVNAGRGGALLINDENLAHKVSSFHGSSPGWSGSIGDFAQALGWWGMTRSWIYTPLRHARRWVREDTPYEVVVPHAKSSDVFACCSGYVARLADRQMESLESNIASRQTLARAYAEGLSGLDGIAKPIIPAGAEPAWIQYPVFVERKQACYEHLLKRGVDLNWTFRYSCGVSYGVHTAPNSDLAARTVLGLPTYPGLKPEEAHRICSLLRLSVQN